MQLTLTNIIELMTIVSAVGGGIWIVATMKQTISQLVDSVTKLNSSTERLTDSVNKLGDRVDHLEHDHEQRLMALEQKKQ